MASEQAVTAAIVAQDTFDRAPDCTSRSCELVTWGESGCDTCQRAAFGLALDAAFPVMLRERVEAMSKDALRSLAANLSAAGDDPHVSDAVVTDIRATELLRALGVEP